MHKTLLLRLSSLLYLHPRAVYAVELHISETKKKKVTSRSVRRRAALAPMQQEACWVKHTRKTGAGATDVERIYAVQQVWVSASTN